MRSYAVLIVALAMVTAGCGATTRGGTTTIQTPASPALTSATATFISRDHGKDEDSNLTVQLLRQNAELMGEIRAANIKFDDNSSSGPFAFSPTGTFRRNDIEDGQIRVTFIPDGQDDWTFDLNLVMRFDDGSTRTFMWRGLRLDNSETSRTLALATARIS
jgi:hypothetical protein